MGVINYRKDSAKRQFDYKTGAAFWPIIWRLLHRLIYKTGQFCRLLWVPRGITKIDDRFKPQIDAAYDFHD